MAPPVAPVLRDAAPALLLSMSDGLERAALSPSLRGAKRRSNPDCLRRCILDCFAALAMTIAGASNSVFKHQTCVGYRFAHPGCATAPTPSLRGARDNIAEQFCAEATKQSRLSPRMHSGLLRCARNDGVEAHWGAFNSHFNCRHTSTFPRHVLPELCSSHPLQNREGAGKTGRRLAPMGPVRQACAKCTGRTRDSRDIPAFPAQWVDGLWRALPGDEFLFVTVASRIDGSSRPVGPMEPPRKLDCSNDSQDHTLLPYASAPFVMHGA